MFFRVVKLCEETRISYCYVSTCGFSVDYRMDFKLYW